MRSFIKIIENYNQPKDISVESDYGSAEGYVVDSDKEQLPNWLNRNYIFNDNLINTLREKYNIIAFLNNINVNDDERGKGYGNNLFEDFKDNAQDAGANAILLLADTTESQEEGFDLVAWYKNWGLEILLDTTSGPLMLFEF